MKKHILVLSGLMVDHSLGGCGHAARSTINKWLDRAALEGVADAFDATV